jgi:MATE family multidrug resistance protein
MQQKNNREVSHSQIFHLAWPMIISNLSVPLLGIVDIAILGHLDNSVYLAAVATGASLLTFLLWSFGFLKMGTSGIVARAYGAKNLSGAMVCFWQSTFLAIALGFGLWIVQWLLFPVLVDIINPNSNVFPLALEYAQIRMWSAPCSLLNYVILGWFIGRQNTKVPLLLLVFTNVLNIIFDYVLIIGWELNSQGAAWASVLADALGCALGLYLVYRGLFRDGISMRVPFFDVIDRLAFKKLFQINSDLFIRTSFLLGVLLFFNAQSARLGENILSANAILLQLVAVISYGLDGFAHAAEALVGKFTGAKDDKNFWSTCLKTGLWAVITALLFSSILLVGQSVIIQVFTDIPAVVDAARQYYFWIVGFALISFLAYHLDGVFIGWGEVRFMRISMIFCTLIVFLPTWLLTKSMGNHGLWLAFLLFNFFRGVSLLFFLFFKKRKNYEMI